MAALTRYGVPRAGQAGPAGGSRLVGSVVAASTVTVTTSRATAWVISGAIAGTRATTWAALTPAESSRVTLWAALNTAPTARATTWNLGALAQVPGTVTIVSVPFGSTAITPTPVGAALIGSASPTALVGVAAGGGATVTVAPPGTVLIH